MIDIAASLKIRFERVAISVNQRWWKKGLPVLQFEPKLESGPRRVVLNKSPAAKASAFCPCRDRRKTLANCPGRGRILETQLTRRGRSAYLSQLVKHAPKIEFETLMNGRLIVVADLGLLRAYEVVNAEIQQDRKPSLKRIAEFRPAEGNEKISDQVTDQQGRFSKGLGANATSGNLSSGERNDLKGELDRRALSGIAEKIDELVGLESVTSFWLAASAPIHKQLVDQLDPASRQKLGRVVASNLATTPPTELLSHFEKAAAR